MPATKKGLSIVRDLQAANSNETNGVRAAMFAAKIPDTSTHAVEVRTDVVGDATCSTALEEVVAHGVHPDLYGMWDDEDNCWYLWNKPGVEPNWGLHLDCILKAGGQYEWIKGSPTKKVRVNLSALTRMEWSAIVEVPITLDADDLDTVARNFYDKIDAGEWHDDPDYWERGEQHCDTDHVQETDHPQYTVDADLEITEVPTKTFVVYERREATMKYIVEARNAAEAKYKIEASEDAEDEFDGSIKDGGTWIDNVEEA